MDSAHHRAISQARERLGEAPVKVLFERVAAPLAAPGAWLGYRRLMAIDGVKLDAPDTAANLPCLGRPGGVTRRPFPQVRVLGPGECGTHELAAEPQLKSKAEQAAQNASNEQALADRPNLDSALRAELKQDAAMEAQIAQQAWDAYYAAVNNYTGDIENYNQYSE